MTQMWETVHWFAAKVGLCVAPSNPPEACRWKAPCVAPLEDTPVLQSESDPRFRGEPLPPDDDEPRPPSHPP